MDLRKFTADLLECGVYDIDYMVKALSTCEDNDIEIDVTEVMNTYGSMNVNNFISECLYKLAEGFLIENTSKIEETLNIGDFDRYRENNDMYQIYANYIDSHIWFENESIQSLYENSSYYI